MILFMGWMLFFDRNNLITQFQLKLDLNKLDTKNELYKEKIKEVKSGKNEIFSDPAALERFAREKYWMKKSNEDLYIIVEE